MSSDRRKRLRLGFDSGDWRKVKAMLDRHYPRIDHATAARFIMSQLAEHEHEFVISGLAGTHWDAMGPIRYLVCPEVSRGVPASPEESHPMGGKDSRARSLSSPDLSSPALTEKNSKKVSKGKAGKAESQRVAESVIARINELRQVGRDFGVTAWVEPIGRLLRQGHTEAEMIEVVEWRAAECGRTGDWQWYKPATLFRPGSFAAKLDECRAGVSHYAPRQGAPAATVDHRPDPKAVAAGEARMAALEAESKRRAAKDLAAAGPLSGDIAGVLERARKATEGKS